MLITRLIRSNIHRTTRAGNGYIDDPKGWHVTVSFKDHELEQTKQNITAHGYTYGEHNFTLKEVTYTEAKSDTAGHNPRKPAWPDNSRLVDWEDDEDE